MSRLKALGFVVFLNVLFVALQVRSGTDMYAIKIGWCLGILDGLAVTLIK